MNQKQLIDELYECASVHEFKQGLKNYAALWTHKLYRKIRPLSPNDLQMLHEYLQKMQESLQTQRDIENVLKSIEERLAQERESQKILQRDLLNVFDRWFKRSSHDEKERLFQQSLNTTLQLEEEKRTLQEKITFLQEERHTQEHSLFRQFFQGLPKRITIPERPNVFGIDDDGFKASREGFRYFGQRSN